VQALGWLGAGVLVLRPLDRSGDRALDLLNRVGAGAVAFALLTFVAGWLGLVYAVVFVPLLIGASVVGALELARALRRVRLPRVRAWPRWQLALGVIVALYALADVVITCAPISSADALFYHATAPELFEREHRIEEIPWSWQSYQPFTVELLILDGLLLWDTIQGAFVPLLLGLGGAATVLVGAHRLAGRSVALLAATLYLAQPFALWLFTSTFVEPAAAFTVALAALNLVRFVRGAALEALVLAGLFTGATAGMKYVAAGAAAVLAAWAVLLLRRRLTIRHALAFGVPALAVALPWYVKNLIIKGDPAYPILFGWESEAARIAARDSFDLYGHGHSLIDLVLLPMRLLADAEAFDRAEYITPLFLLFAPVALLDPGTRRAVATALAGVAAFVVVWFLGAQDSRYLMFAMPILAVVAALGIFALARQGKIGRLVAVSGVACALLVSGFVSLAYASQFAKVVVGLESDEEFLRDKVSYHEGVAWLNETLPEDASVVVDHVFLLHIERPALTWNADALPPAAGARETREFVRRYGLTHALIFTGNPYRLRQLGYVGARRVGRVTVHPVISRTRSDIGPPETMDLYRIEEDRSREASSASASRRSSDGRGRATMNAW
jgi:hypothetical protein